ncbi:YciC family protein [Buchnera aphidicola]|uniref:YciC family protein n=1 Tax=Buchnera aphidicola TaxID=9 RepID=UPI00094D4350|nr:YciC family protein [Buchnera aphidicola]
MLCSIYIVMYDVYQFFKKNIINIFVLSVLSAIINILLQYMLNINKTDLSILYQAHAFKKIGSHVIQYRLNANQKKIIFYMKRVKVTCLLVSAAFLYTSIIYFLKSIYLTVYQKYYYVLKKTCQFFFLLIPIIGLEYLLIELNISYFFILKILFSMLLATFPMILLLDNNGILGALRSSARIAWDNIYIVFPAIILRFIFKFFVTILFKFCFMFSVYTNIFVLNVILNLGLSYIIICLFRLYLLQKKSVV